LTGEGASVVRVVTNQAPFAFTQINGGQFLNNLGWGWLNLPARSGSKFTHVQRNWSGKRVAAAICRRKPFVKNGRFNFYGWHSLRSKQVVERTGWPVFAKSVNGKSVMNNTLEILEPEARATALKPAKQKILLVDDDPAIRQILLRLLTDENYSVIPAANGVEASAFAEVTKFDLVLLDLNMPIKDGWETFEQLSAQNPLLPFILITARPNQLFPALASGVGALLEKPLDFVKLFSTIRTLLEEPEDARLARYMGRSSVFSYIPPIP
jgi:CheY-like chemotaxis protein